MKELNKLLDRITQQINIALRELDYDVHPYVRNLVPLDKMAKFYAFYGITPHHPLDFEFRHSGLAGSYFLGKCRTSNSVLYKSDIRGDELKHKGDIFRYGTLEIPVTRDEGIDIEHSFLVKTLVHNYSHDPETPEKFFIKDTVAAHYANIHGSPSQGCFLGPFATVDLTTVRDCVVGTFSYVQAGEIAHLNIDPGTVWVRSPEQFNFLYRYPVEPLRRYIHFAPGRLPGGDIVNFVEERKGDFQYIFDVVNIEPSVPVPDNTSLDRYAVVKPKTRISENVLVAQRAYLQNARLGKGSNAQENCYIVHSTLAGFDVTAHGAKIIEADLEENVFVGFNSFLRGCPGGRLSIGKESIIMPHTIIDIKEPLSIPPAHLVWGLIRESKDLEANSMALEAFSKIHDHMVRGNLSFEGSGASFVSAFRNRIHHILEANGAFFDGKDHRGHAQKNQNIAFNMIQPYPGPDFGGLYPTTIIQA